jgi:uncharacterized protein YnzC (UPF0291/DUF896 family)
MIDFTVINFELSEKPFQNLLNRMRGKEAITPEKALNEIHELAKRNKEKKILYASIGTAEVTVLMRRWYAEQTSSSIYPRFESIELIRMSDNVIETLTLQGLITLGFRERLSSNIQTIKEMCNEQDITFIERSWPKLPVFHGYLYGENAFVAPWIIDRKGFLAHHTLLQRLSKDKHLQEIENYRELFKAP